MPIYEFTCKKCGQDSEQLVRSTNWRGATCPHCGSKKLTKKLSVFASAVATDAPAGCPLPAKKRRGGRGGGCCGGACGCG